MTELELRKISLELAIKHVENNQVSNVVNIASMFYQFLNGEMVIPLPQYYVDKKS